MNFIELTLYYSDMKTLINLNSICRIAPESDGGCKIWFLVPVGIMENYCRVKESYEEVKDTLGYRVRNNDGWQPWSYPVTKPMPVTCDTSEK